MVLIWLPWLATFSNSGRIFFSSCKRMKVDHIRNYFLILFCTLFWFFFHQKQMKLFSWKLLRWRLARFFRLPGSKSESLLFAFWFLMRLGLVYLNFLSLCALPMCYFRQHKVLIIPSRDSTHGFYVLCPLLYKFLSILSTNLCSCYRSGQEG